MKLIDLTEYQPQLVPRGEIPESVVEKLQQKYSPQVDVVLKYSKTGDFWKLTSQGWVGHIPLTTEFYLALHPKVPLQNLFGMLEYAYQLKNFRFLQGLIGCHSLEEFYTQLADVLAQQILERSRKGFYRTYLPKTDKLAYVRGRVDMRQAIQKPWDVKLKCRYQEHTVDIAENQVLAWTLFIIGRSGFCKERVLPKVRQAYHALQGLVTLQSFSAQDCVGRSYNRLNEDYRQLHALCRFFLENTGPSHERGESSMLPFVVDMSRLYELFVAEWLKQNTPQNFCLKQQQLVTITQNRHFRIDMLLCDRKTGAVRYVLDTKYKMSEKAAINDIHEMVSYATATKCNDAILIYPKHLTQSLDVKIHDIRVRSLTFSLDSNLDAAGKALLKDLFD